MIIKFQTKGGFLVVEKENGKVDRYIRAITNFNFNDNKTVLSLLEPQGTLNVTNSYNVSNIVDENGDPFENGADGIEDFLDASLGVLASRSDNGGGEIESLDELFVAERDVNGSIIKTRSIYDLQVPPQSIEVGEAIKMSDLAQSIGYSTKYDDKQYIVMSYEVTDGETTNPTIKEFAEPSSFELQPLFNRQESFVNSVSFPLIAVQNVIGKIYNLKASTTSELRIRLYRTGVTNYVGQSETQEALLLSEEDLVAYDVKGKDTLVVDEVVKASETDINGFDFELKPLTDFVSGASYRLELSVLSGNIEVKGTQITPTFFFPYIKRTFGWQYTNKELAFKDEVPVFNGNAAAEFSHYSFKSGVDNDAFFDDGLIRLSWDSPGNDLEVYMLTEPAGNGDLVTLATKGNSSVVSTYITEPNFKYDVYPAGVNGTEGLVVWISAEDDELYPSYKIHLHNAGSSYNSNVEVKKIIPKI
tara:strand:+ start:1654 stop:3072 length:1419 start_codon:yes stop_codon:yes gene_type:complete